MSDNFEWQTEDNTVWEVEETRLPHTAVSRRWPWRALSIIVVLLALAGLLGYWQFSRRIEMLTAAIELDVLSTHNLINRAVAEQDTELMAPLLSARDLSWTNTQQQLLERGLFYDRTPLGLSLAPADEMSGLSSEDERYVNIEVAPDMDTAELHFLQTYEVEGQRVVLEQTAVYRRGRNRWLLAPPDASFWGSWQTSETGRLTLVYPERDAAVAQKLAVDLATDFGALCRELMAGRCPAGLRFQVRLETNPESLLAAANPATLYDGNLRVSLPAPTLVGLPVDETGYRLLLRGYTAPLVALLITEQSSWRCCRHAPLYQAFLDYQLSQLGLRPWPVTSEIHTRIINSGANLDMLLPFFLADTFDMLSGTDGWQLYAFVDFLMNQHPVLTPLQILSGLSGEQTWSQWLSGLPGADREEDVLAPERLARDWWLYAHTQMLASQGPQPVAFPPQELQLTCASDLADPDAPTLYRYRLHQEVWEVESSLYGFMFVSPLPGDEGVVWQTVNVAAEEYRPFIWKDGQAMPASNAADPLTLSWGQTDPTGRYLVVYVYQEQTGGVQPALVELAACADDSCAIQLLDGLPVWSPDGAQMLLTELGYGENFLLLAGDGRAVLQGNSLLLINAPLYLADAVGSPESQVLLDKMPGEAGGNLPFWVDEQTYGYVYAGQGFTQDAPQEVVLASTLDDTPATILTTDDLLAAIPEETRPLRLSIRYVQAHPTNPEWLVIFATSRSENYLYLVNRADNLIENRLQFKAHDSLHFFGFSPDGRYFITTGAPEENFTVPQNVITYFLHDLARNQTQTYIAGFSSLLPAFAFDWSANGRWLALIMNNGAINLIAPGYNYQQLILHDFGNCSSVAWVNPRSDRP